MVIVEKSFPRGGTISVHKRVKDDEPAEQIVFGAVQKKFKKSKAKAAELKEDENLEASSAELLNHDTIQEGMIIMGIIKKIDQLFLHVSLPGRMTAKVSALDISDAYTKSVERFLHYNQMEGYKSLSDLYKIGQLVYGRVQDIKRNERGYTLIEMSLKPSFVHSELSHDRVRKGFIFAGSIEAIEEHGYIMECGIKGVRCFLPFDKSEMGLEIGQFLFMKITKVTHDKATSTCICKQMPPDELAVKNQPDINLDYLLPSTIVKFRVNKLLPNGVQGTIMDETFTAYANEHQLTDPLTLPDDLEVNHTYQARILYVMPLTKFVFVTLNIRGKVAHTETSDILKRGTIIENAKVHHLGTGGVVMILNDNIKGILSYKTIKANYKGNYDQDVLLTKYAKNSVHKVRILDYDAMDSLYICTDDAHVINEKYFMLEDLQPGDFVTAIIQERNEKIGGYTVQVGKIRGIIEKLYLASAAKLLETGTKIKCRVICINMERSIIYLTNRAEYMAKNCKLLKSVEDANINAKYMGTVVNCSDGNFTLVKFFGDTKGALYKSEREAATLTEGQTMMFRIAGKKDGQLILSLLESEFKFGEICPVTVVQNLESGLEIQVVYHSDNGTECIVKGLIPTRLLSDFEDLLLAKLGIFSIGDELNAAAISRNIFSLRDVEYFGRIVVPKWHEVNRGDVVKAYVQNVSGDDDVVELTVAIANYRKPVKLHAKMLLTNALNLGNITLSAEQVLYVKIVGKDIATKTMALSGKLMDVWQGKLDVTAEYVESYLNEVKHIKKALKKKKCSISNYSVGQKVTARFQYVDESTKDWIYTLKKTEAFGIVKCHQVNQLQIPKPDECQECIIIWIDYSNGVIYLSNRKSDVHHISQGEKLAENLFGTYPLYHEAKVLFKNQTIMVCSLKKKNQPPIYCPVKLYFNDIEEIAAATIAEGDFLKLAFIHRTLPIAVPQHIHKLYHVSNKRKNNAEENNIIGKSKKVKVQEKEEGTAVLDASSSDSTAKKTIEQEKTEKGLQINAVQDASSSGSKSKKSKSQEKTEKDLQANAVLDASSSGSKTKKSQFQKKKQEDLQANGVLASSSSSNDKSKKSQFQEEKEKGLQANAVLASSPSNDKSKKSQFQEKEEKSLKTNTLQNASSTPNVSPDIESNSKMVNDSTSETLFFVDKTPSKKLVKETVPASLENTKAKRVKMIMKQMPNVSGFWNTDLGNLNGVEESSEDELEVPQNESEAKVVKKKLSASEKFKLEREEEARLRAIEEKYSDPKQIPETIDQFDRLVLSEPDSSKSWINYMVFHLQSSEIDKARSVARRALKTISFRNVQDRLNVWMALLNLELRYNNKETFDDTLKEALMCNDPKNIYLRTLEILTDAQKTTELLELVAVATRKFGKSELDIWQAAANALFTIGMAEKAQQLLHKSLASLPEREHVTAIVTFANLNYKHGFSEMAQTLLDQVITSYPKRVDVWSQYVDMLIKEELIDSARNVLERAVCQTIPLRKMRTIFKKYLEFEERYGDDAKIQRVKQLATDFVNKSQHL